MSDYKLEYQNKTHTNYQVGESATTANIWSIKGEGNKLHPQLQKLPNTFLTRIEEEEDCIIIRQKSWQKSKSQAHI